MSSNDKSTVRIGEQNRQKILAAAEQEFALHGFKGTAVQAIAESAGLPKTNVLYYFKSKQKLYQAVLDDIVQLWDSGFDQASFEDDPAEMLAAYIAQKMMLSRTRPQASKIFAMEIINGAPNLDQFFAEQHRHWMQGRIEVIQQWIKQGLMAKTDPTYLLFTIWACSQHYADFSAQISGLKGHAMDKQDFDQATGNLIKLILTGCGLTVPAQYQ
ncbi:TetR/AcrR family transcriptional regulator [Neptunicella sp. SCSIO 80796]|uniref:TetR/AcrR family transcriptional regulator n=1 Tax=Neptunicella plasticusilytica TaxID=3117012 RepID=UPI003A4D4B17